MREYTVMQRSGSWWVLIDGDDPSGPFYTALTAEMHAITKAQADAKHDQPARVVTHTDEARTVWDSNSVR